SSRRRHTRSKRDWSSDVCSSDLFLSLRLHTIDDFGAYFVFAITGNTNMMSQISGPYTIGSLETGIKAVLTNKNQQGVFRGAGSEIGRASCRERVVMSGLQWWSGW